jgi:hypothetical protein
MPTETSQPSSNGEKCESLAASATTLATPESTSICLNPPPAVTISRIPATPGKPAPSELLISSRFIPASRPRLAIATSRATAGVPIKSAVLSLAASFRAQAEGLQCALEGGLGFARDRHGHPGLVRLQRLEGGQLAG